MKAKVLNFNLKKELRTSYAWLQHKNKEKKHGFCLTPRHHPNRAAILRSKKYTTVNLKPRKNDNSQMIRKQKIYCLWRKTNRSKVCFNSFTVFSLPRELFHNRYLTRLKYQIINSRTLSRRVSDVSAMFALFWSLMIVIFCATLDIFFSCQ